MNNELILKAKKALKKAHPKLSGYKVGAAVEGLTGNIHIGYNVETDIHHAIHAEMMAICSLIENSNEKIKQIVVACVDRAWFPCGWCRQWIWEYSESPETQVIAYCVSTNEIEVATISELLPKAFKLEL